MVHQTSSKRPSLIIYFLIAFVVAGAVFTAGHFLSPTHTEPEIADTPTEPEPEPEPTEPAKPAFINLQPTVDNWLASLNSRAEVAVYIYDLDNEQIAAEHNAYTRFGLASIYKLFFVYKAYERVEQGIYDGNAYFADGKTLNQCLDKIIRESYNPCAEPLRAKMLDEIEGIIKNEYGIDNTAAGALYASAKATADMLRIYYEHKTLSAETYALILDSMLNQPPTTYNWRQGLPSGFKVAKVYDKVGWNYTGSYWETYDDAAIVEFPDENRHYLMVVLSGYINYTDIAALGSQLETAILAY